MQIGELVRKIDVPYRHARHRQLEPIQACWLALPRFLIAAAAENCPC